jgi:D-alanine-D-alanine ligase-like ATP-grasp enzyme
MDNNTFSVVEGVVSDMGGTIEEFIPERNCFCINVLGKRVLLKRNISITRQTFVSAQQTTCKDITHKLLTENDLPVPMAQFFYANNYNKEQEIKKLNSLKYPIILKPSMGFGSRGIFPDIKNVKSAIKVIEKNLTQCKSMIAQEMVFGKEYRVLVLGDEIIAALQNIHPHIIGDGVSKVKEMIKEKQKTTEKKTKFDKKLKQVLESQGVSLKSVLPKGKIIYFKGHACLAEGGETKDVTDIVHEKVKDICVKASKTVGKYLVGIDIICDDISSDPIKGSFNILEMNGKPDLYIHYEPDHGKTRNVLKKIISFLATVSVLPLSQVD